ncbi:MAG: Trehalose transport system permease protein SugB [Alphaproteobacteria bacterium MarineAlpha5_Bin12]|nr:MAG: Trehalose transport system permease protein SugB [Alphaproteobacteria bacterium MarineAlpha5_Bin12]|tara:strand:- start:1268 stop:2158 length:891 start_codon:yes stop_codon:yes gene_type:complete
MALPSYTTSGQRLFYYFYLFFCGTVFFFLIAPLVAIIPISFSVSPFMIFTEGMLTFPPDPEAWSLRWYRYMVGICTDKSLTTPCGNKWMYATVNSFFVGLTSTFIATSLGTLAALGLSRPHMPYKGLIMSILISPMIVPLIITAAGMFFFYARFNLVYTFTGIIMAHVALATPFVVITVTATLVGFDTNMTKASQSLGAKPIRTFFKVIMPLILPGVISGALFAFITSFDEVVIVMFMASLDQLTIPKQMWAGIRQEISPVILCMATCLVVLSILLLSTVEILRRRAERLRGIKAR